MDITIYGAEWCAGCKQVKAKLDSDGVAYKAVDIDCDDLTDAPQLRSLPSAMIDGELFVGVSNILNKIKE